jgi:hypothetical protein
MKKEHKKKKYKKMVREIGWKREEKRRYGAGKFVPMLK